MAGLVLEGGSLRGLFTAGALDALLDNDVNFSYIIGVSAGITNGMSYISKQKGRNIEIIKKYRNDKRYISMRNLIKYKSIFGLDFIFDEIANNLHPLDRATYDNFEGTIKIGITDAITGEAVYKSGKNMDKKHMILRATCAIPLLSPPIQVNGKEYFDGGLANPIPIKQSIADGNTKNLIILTQPKGFVKQPAKSAKLVSIVYSKKYPELVKILNNRHELYNNTIKFIAEHKKQNPDDIVILQPEYKLSSFEADVAVLEKTYMHGYEVATRNMAEILNAASK